MCDRMGGMLGIRAGFNTVNTHPGLGLMVSLYKEEVRHTGKINIYLLQLGALSVSADAEGRRGMRRRERKTKSS